MKKLFIVTIRNEHEATCSIETFYSEHKACNHIFERIGYDIQPDVDQTLVSFVSQYYEWLNTEERDCEVHINYEIVNL